jgi:hypothetical protein
MSMYIHLSTTRPKAAKNYVCNLCGFLIPKGIVHVKNVGICEGDQYSARVHTQCHDATASWDIDDWEGFQFATHEFRLNCLTAEQIKEILNLGKHPLQDIMDAINTQDNRCTSHPMFCVQAKVLDDECDNENHLWHWETATVCFTLKGAEEFINTHKHNLGETRIYVESYYRNAEMIRVRDWLMGQGVKKEVTK